MDMQVAAATSADQLELIRRLFRAYAAELEIDLGFQGFEAELAGLPGKYAPPTGGLWLATCDGEPAGCVAVRPLDAATCEMKRLYVCPPRRSGLGRRLAQVAVEFGRRAGYARMVLDTLERMTAPLRMYESMGFRRCQAYYPNPVADAVYLSMDLAAGDVVEPTRPRR